MLYTIPLKKKKVYIVFKKMRKGKYHNVSSSYFWIIGTRVILKKNKK